MPHLRRDFCSASGSVRLSSRLHLVNTFPHLILFAPHQVPVHQIVNATQRHVAMLPQVRSALVMFTYYFHNLATLSDGYAWQNFIHRRSLLLRCLRAVNSKLESKYLGSFAEASQLLSSSEYNLVRSIPDPTSLNAYFTGDCFIPEHGN